MEELRYPIGRYQSPEFLSSETTQAHILALELFPTQLQSMLKNVNDEMLRTSYRPNGWNLAQIVHHCADSHMNAYMRTKWALTENSPLIKAYDETSWALLSDAQEGMPIDVSVQLISALHHRWVHVLRSLQASDFQKTFLHPETGKLISVQELTSIYAWHSRHHLAHIHLIVHPN